MCAVVPPGAWGLAPGAPGARLSPNRSPAFFTIASRNPCYGLGMVRILGRNPQVIHRPTAPIWHGTLPAMASKISRLRRHDSCVTLARMAPRPATHRVIRPGHPAGARGACAVTRGTAAAPATIRASLAGRIASGRDSAPLAVIAPLAGRIASGRDSAPLAVIAPLTRAYRASRGVATTGAIATRNHPGHVAPCVVPR
jgi:hypothetical protein